MKRAIGMICEKSSLLYTCVISPDVVDEEAELPTPASKTERGAQLDWLLTTAEDLFVRLEPDIVYLKRPAGTMAAPERHEVHGVVLAAAHRVGVHCAMKTTEQVRAAFVPKGKGAFESLFNRPDVAARSNLSRRERYLYAMAALKQQSR